MSREVLIRVDTIRQMLVIGLMKDELAGKIMIEFVALRPKLYAYRKLNNEEDKKCKGMKKCIGKKTLDFDDYKNCLLNLKSTNIYRSQLTFRNKKHEIHMVEVSKVVSNRDDDKRIVKDVHRRQKLTTDVFQTFRVDYFGCEYLNFEK